MDLLIAPKSETQRILDELRARYGSKSKPEQWVFFEELRVGTGYGAGAEQRIDAWAMNLYPSKQLARIAFEVKISRSDFLREMTQPQKRRAAMFVANQFYFVTPPGLIKPSELPMEAGLIEVGNYPQTVVEAPWRDDVLPSWSFIAAICRRVYREERDR